MSVNHLLHSAWPKTMQGLFFGWPSITSNQSLWVWAWFIQEIKMHSIMQIQDHLGHLLHLHTYKTRNWLLIGSILTTLHITTMHPRLTTHSLTFLNDFQQKSRNVLKKNSEVIQTSVCAMCFNQNHWTFLSSSYNFYKNTKVFCKKHLVFFLLFGHPVNS